MIKFTQDDFKLFCDEYKKGNNIHILRSKNHIKNMILCVVKKLLVSRRKIEYTDYDISDNSFGVIVDGTSSIFEKWHWDSNDYYILNKKEAQPYIKELIIKNLIGQETN